MEPIPTVDLGRHHRKMRTQIDAAIAKVIDQSSFILGKPVEEFEQAFAKFCGVSHCIGVATGTDALHFTLRALNIGPGDEVILPANTFIATALAVVYAGATVRLVDVAEQTYNIDPDKLVSAITPHTKAIIPVHLYGQIADMDAIQRIAAPYRCAIIEDACQAHGARYRNTRAGEFGVAAAFSFYPGKNIGALGDGGAIVTNDAALAEQLRKLRNYGQKIKHHHEVLGYNSRLDSLQAAVLLVKLAALEENNALRRKHAEQYRQALVGTKALVPQEHSEYESVYHLFVIRHPKRDALAAYLKTQGIETAIHYPVPIHFQPAFAMLGYAPGSFPVAEQLANEILSLPMFPELEQEEIQRVANAIRAFDAQ
ncbi:MAG TPA: DegT/DnrJ/EryC1/StrS family aminotransferase [Candidatus Nanoarchaeia archaeon]|nr:DegT/DnrJ/EryC1/StrS family aminotransferase [Candidatus Nanoarchaeia archaeon]